MDLIFFMYESIIFESLVIQIIGIKSMHEHEINYIIKIKLMENFGNKIRAILNL